MKPVITIVLVFFWSLRLAASNETTVTYLQGIDFLHFHIHNTIATQPTSAALVLQDFLPSGNPNWEQGYKIKKVKSRVELYIDPASQPLNFAYRLTLPVHIFFLDLTHNLHQNEHKLIVDFNPEEGSSHKQLDLYLQEDAYRFQVDVFTQSTELLMEAIPTTSNPNPAPLTQSQKTDIAMAVKIRIVQECEKIYNFDHLTPIQWNQMYLNYDAPTNQLKVCWDVIAGAEWYDLEWCYVEKYDVPYVYQPIPMTSKSASFAENNTRITITENCYTLPIVYESGALMFRVRGRGKVLPDLENTVLGTWSCGKLSGNCSSSDFINPSMSNWVHTYWIYDAHEADNKNWQIISSFAEDGKRKDVVNYMDGTMRTRQTVTVNNSDQNVLVAETIYDHQGRPAVQILPVPVLHDPALKFREKFNRNLANQSYSKLDFDLDADPCIGSIAPLNTISGAAYYYSSQFYNNLTATEQKSHLGYIPESEGYPMIQTEYTPDNTGRIQRQGGAGKVFQLESNHETKYFYATPAQEELDYLFGTNVGIASHYKKNMVMDPNSQVSISYLDAKGNTIATALAGKAPDNLEQLPSYKPFPMTIDLLAYNRIDSINYSLDATFTLAVDSKGDHTFYYGVTAEQFTVPNCTPANVCYDCVYDLELLVVSNECPDTLYRLTRTIGSFIDTTIVPDMNAQDSMVFNINSTCNTPVHFNTSLLPQNNAFVIHDLPIGTYSITKKLKVNQDAAQAYLQHYITDPNNTCTNIYEDILQSQLDLVDEDDCSIDCEDVEGSSDPSDIELAAEICDTLLPNPCKLAFEAMKAHFMPGGQYAEFETVTYDATMYPLSIFNPNNKLKVPARNYQNIWPSGQTTIIDGVTRYMNSLTVEEFISNFDEAWLELLVTLHPEYCMYGRCSDSLHTSETYSNYLNSTNNFNEAVSPSGIFPAFLSNSDPLMIFHNDPYFFSQTNFPLGIDNPGPGRYAERRTQMIGCLEHFPVGNAGDPSIHDLALANSFCGSLDPACLSGTTWNDLTDVANISKATNFWMNYKSLYISCKERVEYQARSEFAMDPRNCYNECIGQDHFNPLINRFWVDEYEFLEDQEPCSLWRFYLFRDKIKAFPSPYDMLPNMDVDFWDYPLDPLMGNISSILPTNPCDSCDCAEEFNRFINFIIFDVLIEGINNGQYIEDIAIPMHALTALFPKIKLGSGLAYGSLHFFKNSSTGKIGLVLGDYPSDDGCTIRFNIDSFSLVELDSIHAVGCPKASPIAITGNFQLTLYYSNGLSTTVTGNSNQCNFECINSSKAKCETSPIAPGLLDVMNQIVQSNNDIILPRNFLVPIIYFGAPLIDSLNIPASNSQYTVHVVQGSDGLLFQFGNCNVKIDFGSYNSSININNILYFSSIEPNFSVLDASGRTYRFSIQAHLDDGTVISCIGNILQPCFSIGRCCKESTPTTQRTASTKTKKSKKQTAEKITKDNSRIKKFPAPLPTDPRPLPSDPELPSKPYDPLCSDCIPIDLIGGIFDTVDFSDCVSALCDSSKWIVITLDSMPDPCVEYLYDVAEHNANILYDEIIDQISQEFLHNYNMKCLKAAEQFTDQYEYGQHHYTLYYYDQSNNLVQTVPPNGVTGLDNAERNAMASYRTKQRNQISPNPIPTVSSIELTGASQYQYNSLNQLTSQKIPDQGYFDASSNTFVKEATVFWYDHLGRLICSQNPEQKQNKEFSYTLYDGLGRIIEVGGLRFPSTSNQPPPSPVSTLNDYTGAAWWSFVNTGSKFEITTTTYDQDFYSGSFPGGFPLSTVENLRGRVGAAAIYDKESNYNLKKPEYITHYSYDIHGNVKALVQDGNNTPPKLMEYEYDLISGKVNKVYYQRNRFDQFTHDYGYDADNRLTLVRTSRNGILWDEDAHYIYYPHGPLARTEIGEYEVQGLDYAYTLQGWIKGMNSGLLDRDYDIGKDGSYDHIHKSFATDEVGYVLNYYETDYKAIKYPAVPQQFETNINGSAYNTATKNLYNGNIRAMITAIDRFKASSGIAGYAYQYDQLNRIKGMDYFKGLNASNSWSGASLQDDYRTRYSYDANGNILNLDRNGTVQGGNQLKMDRFTYNYAQANNRLTHVDDVIPLSNYTTDIDDQTSNNYKYDRIGNLIRDNAEGLSIEWNLSGKVKRIVKDNGDIILFKYDALGNRISKTFKDIISWYVRDASGNVMSLYTKDPPHNSLVKTWHQKSLTIYGSARLGEWYPLQKPLTAPDSDIDLPPDTGHPPTGGSGARKLKMPKPIKLEITRGLIQYELTNHLGNVLATISDRRRWAVTGSLLTHRAHLITAGDYYPGGMLMPGRVFNSSSYRYKHQGQESDPEIYGEGNSYAYRFRMSDPRLNRFWSVDPLSSKYPGNSSYAFAQNRLIDGTELEGLEWQPVNDDWENVENGADNHTGFTWVGFNEDGTAPEGTVADGMIWSNNGNGATFYGVNERTNGPQVGYAEIQDQVTLDRIETLHPDIRRTTKEILLRSEYENGQRLRLTTGWRRQTEQNNLFAQSRTQAQVNAETDAWGNPLAGVVAQPNAQWATGASWGKSYHNYGLAIDVVGYNNNQIQWNIDWNAYHALGQRFGGTTVNGDNPHLTLNFGIHWRTLRNLPTDANGFRILPP
ncbi:MAG: hypothetical protein JPMHGGIA_02822 [Saprospiraceae bacterium]|nr:hypothetical protein [Saprospiraceae bacterium]